jgi:hypothetical protein
MLVYSSRFKSAFIAVELLSKHYTETSSVVER